jgi:FMN phosphatase YigB (HAD superfamily)
MTSATSLPVRGIIFDLDGTLYALRWYLAPLFFMKLFPRGLRLMRFLQVRETFAGADLKSQDGLLAAISERLAVRAKVSPVDARRWIDGAFYTSYIAIMPFFRCSRPGIAQLLAALRAKGIRVAVLSDFGRVPERLRQLRITPSLFDTVASCEAAGALKPHPRPFLDIAKDLGVPPRDVLVVGDRADTDGVAAQSAGMQFVRICDWRARARGGVGWKTLRGMLLALPDVRARAKRG